MGGRGASSGTSKMGNPYGSQYHGIITVGNVKFVEKNFPGAETLMETMTRGRVYAYVDATGEVNSIVYFDNENKRTKQIDLKRPHDGVSPHVHHGYFHNENDSGKGYSRLTSKEQAMVERVVRIWDNHRGK